MPGAWLLPLCGLECGRNFDPGLVSGTVLELGWIVVFVMTKEPAPADGFGLYPPL